KHANAKPRKWERKSPVLVNQKLDAAEADKLLDEATSYWKGRLDSLTSEERTAEMKVIWDELLSNRFDLSTVVDVKFNGRVSGKADSPASKKRAQDLEKIYAEIGNLVGQASM